MRSLRQAEAGASHTGEGGSDGGERGGISAGCKQHCPSLTRARLPTSSLGADEHVEHTFYWPVRAQSQGEDFKVVVITLEEADHDRH